MPLRNVDLNWQSQPGPKPAEAALINDAHERIEQFLHHRQATGPIPSFVTCDFVMACRALSAIVEQRVAPGPVFCEWGAGFGVVAGLAALQGMASHAIEIHRDLVDPARRLLQDHDIEIELAQGSFVPEDGDEIIDQLAEQAWLATGEHPAYDELGIDVCDIDLIFAYPWPGEEGLIEALFEAFAADGALLLTYHGMNEMRLQRKIG